jgi:hypothetical protein
MNSKGIDNEFRFAGPMLSELATSRITETYKDKSNEKMFQNTGTFLKMSGERKNKKNKELWWDFYIPFFYDLANSTHIATYCNYISYNSNENSKNWLDNNPDKVKSFGN